MSDILRQVIQRNRRAQLAAASLIIDDPPDDTERMAKALREYHRAAGRIEAYEHALELIDVQP